MTELQEIASARCAIMNKYKIFAGQNIHSKKYIYCTCSTQITTVTLQTLCVFLE